MYVERGRGEKEETAGKEEEMKCSVILSGQFRIIIIIYNNKLNMLCILILISCLFLYNNYYGGLSPCQN